MANSLLCFTSVCSFNTSNKPELQESHNSFNSGGFYPFVNLQGYRIGTRVNPVDRFNGQFKAGGLCWLCRDKSRIGI
ncbi:hypothetical protein V6N11_026802 [Hibiscus sabdariffa]|uniref:BSD2 cysteine rich domain-containing protein n=1 Tax=Hibiscus sabdariffa TaxID=183260 RepID=A0ABR2SWU8_9ROSI